MGIQGSNITHKPLRSTARLNDNKNPGVRDRRKCGAQVEEGEDGNPKLAYSNPFVKSCGYHGKDSGKSIKVNNIL